MPLRMKLIAFYGSFDSISSPLLHLVPFPPEPSRIQPSGKVVRSEKALKNEQYRSGSMILQDENSTVFDR